MNYEYKWIKMVFVKNSPSGKTMIFYVMNKLYNENLGEIKWNPGYRKYAFYPSKKTFYEEDCLRDIAEFLEQLKVRKDDIKTN